MANKNEQLWIDELSIGIDEYRVKNEIKMIDNWYEAGVEDVRTGMWMRGRRTVSQGLLRTYRGLDDDIKDWYLTPFIKAANEGVPIYWDLLLTIANGEAALKGDLKKWVMAVANGKVQRKIPKRGRPKKGAKPETELGYPNDDDNLIHTVLSGIMDLTEVYKLKESRNALKQGDRHSAMDAIVEAYFREGISLQRDIKNGNGNGNSKRKHPDESEDKPALKIPDTEDNGSHADKAFNRVKNIWNCRKTKHKRIYQAILYARKIRDRNVLRIKKD